MNTLSDSLEDGSRFFIPTPMTDALKSQIELWLHCGMTGGLILGDARLGKTVGIRSIGDRILNRFNEPIHIFTMHYGKRDVQSIRAVYAKVAKALGFKVGNRTADSMSEDITFRLAEVGLSNSDRKVVLIVDEAQFLSIDQLDTFAEIYNELFDRAINCVIFFVANQNQFRSLGQALLLKENDYLLKRFFLSHYVFYGIRNERELTQCLSRYDTHCVTQSQQTAIEYHCPNLAKAGWTLSSLGCCYWRQFRERFGVPLAMSSLGMAAFVRTTNVLVMDYLPLCEDPNDTETQEACVVKSLEASGIESSLVKLFGGQSR